MGTEHVEDKFKTTPVDELKLGFERNGDVNMVPALHIGWAEDHNFIPYIPLRNRKANSPDYTIGEADKEIWLETVKHFEEDCKFLLRLPHHRFWSQIIYHDGARRALDSFLLNAIRPYDINAKDVPDDMNVLYQSVYRLVFLLYMRMGTYKESKQNHITPSVFANFIYDYYLFDIPKVLDLCALYNPSNKAILQKLIANIFSQQPKYKSDLITAIKELEKLLSSLLKNLGLNQEDDDKDRARMPKPLNQSKTSLSPSDVQDQLLYFVDTVATIHSFLDVYHQALETFYVKNFHIRLAQLYSLVVPFMKKEFKLWQGNSTTLDVIRDFKAQLSFARTCVLKTFRLMMDKCCIHIPESGPMMFKETCFENFLRNMHLVLSEKSFIQDYEKRYPFREDLDTFRAAGHLLDDERISYIHESLVLIMDSDLESHPYDGGNAGKFGSAEGGQPGKSSPILEDAAIALSNLDTEVYRPPQEDLDLKVCQVRDLFPELGYKFIKACLEHFNFDCEKVVNAILEGSLPKHIQEINNIPERHRTVSNSSTEEANDLKKITLALSEKLLIEENEDDAVYQDEYDDTYDEQMIGVKETTAWDDYSDKK